MGFVTFETVHVGDQLRLGADNEFYVVSEKDDFIIALSRRGERHGFSISAFNGMEFRCVLANVDSPDNQTPGRTA